MKSILDKLSEEVVFIVLLFVFSVSVFFRIPTIEAIDWGVLAALWNLMVVALALEEQRFLDYLANKICIRYHTERKLAFALIGLSALFAMFMTNDVALLTLVPITIIIGKKGRFNPYKLVALETIAANVGSSLTPFGNPQNIFLFNYFNMKPLEFFSFTAPFVIISMIGLLLIAMTCSKNKLDFDLEKIIIKSKTEIIVYLGLLAIAILSILHVLSWHLITPIIFIVIFIMKKKLIIDVDYFLLGTFVLFFLLVDNLIALDNIVDIISTQLQTPLKTMWVSSIASQGISNVPAAILLSPFTLNKEALLIGVSLGGFGTLIASLANLISWKLYIKAFPKRKYFRYFTLTNVILLIFVGAIMTLWILN